MVSVFYCFSLLTLTCFWSIVTLLYMQLVYCYCCMLTHFVLFYSPPSNEEWISTSSPGSVPSSAPPLSPSPGSQNHSYSANMSNGYASPMSAGSYDPYSPNGKPGE